jgi:hypothetical protein
VNKNGIGKEELWENKKEDIMNKKKEKKDKKNVEIKRN